MTQNQAKIQGKFYPLQQEEWLRACRELKPAHIAVLYYLKTLNPDSEKLSVSNNDIASALGITRSTVSRAICALHEKHWLPDWFEVQFREQNNVELTIRDTSEAGRQGHRLKAEVGGQVEVVTAVGRIDLLTATELIEVKDIQDWKNALGQTLAYSAFFPTHSKRIHLFGKADLTKLALAQATCSEFDITVTFEEVQ
jgi:DNA-binding MarR family transcriptional regulator